MGIISSSWSIIVHMHAYLKSVGTISVCCLLLKYHIAHFPSLKIWCQVLETICAGKYWPSFGPELVRGVPPHCFVCMSKETIHEHTGRTEHCTALSELKASVTLCNVAEETQWEHTGRIQDTAQNDLENINWEGKGETFFRTEHRAAQRWVLCSLRACGSAVRAVNEWPAWH